ncbi:hypothetical protein PDE_06339 [Penicillium oxalicum 114-2]|uniref:Uncharacterized protein n=1 Tax=Penicillium oxalicum (strain 114-2 / CGMCC 5302) TaxID=933388 RepID=S7ZM43_PENO1|nr:hypothetical protein PDE_06339 [Penicillium oxalicum 114-2]
MGVADNQDGGGGRYENQKKRNEYSLLKFEITCALLNEFVLTREFSSTRRLFKKKSKDCRYQRSREKGPKERSDAKKEKTNATASRPLRRTLVGVRFRKMSVVKRINLRLSEEKGVESLYRKTTSKESLETQIWRQGKYAV